MADRFPSAARPLARGAGLLLVLAALGACSSDRNTAATVPPTAAPTAAPIATNAPTPTAPATPPPQTAPPTAAPTTALPIPDGPTLLQQAFDQIAAGYHFVSTATVNGTVALSTEGDQIGASSRQTVTSQGKTVDYLVLPEGTWFAENGEWNELDSAAGVGDPLAPLRAPLSVTVTGNTPDLTTLVAAYPAATLSMQGDQPVNVTFELSGTALRSISYASPDGTAVSRTDVSPLADTTPITSPSA